MSRLLVLPIALPLATAALSFLAAGKPMLQRAISLAGSLGLLGVAILLTRAVWRESVLVVQVGDWPAPYGITLVADPLSAVMVLIAAVIGLAVTVYSLADLPPRTDMFGYHSLLQCLIGGVCGAFLTGDLFNLYVWFEVALIASFALLVFGGTKLQLDGAVKYVALNLVGTIAFLIAIGLLYGLTGTLNMADLHLKVKQVEDVGHLTVVAVLFIFAFGIKSAVFPLFFWMPASYHTPPAAVSGVFAGLLTKLGVYSLIRLFTLVFTQDTGYTHTVMLWVAALTMVTGVLGAAAQNEFRRILAFHSVSQIGYMLLGLALYTPLALAGATFYMLHHSLVKANLFLVSGVASRMAGSFELDQLGGLYRQRPWLAFYFFLSAFSLAGFPPFSGFWAKFVLVKASVVIEHYAVAGIALAVGLLTTYSMTKIWDLAFWKSRPTTAGPWPAPLSTAHQWLLLAPVGLLAVLTLVLGLWAGPILELALRAGEQLMDPSDYVRMVLHRSPS